MAKVNYDITKNENYDWYICNKCGERGYASKEGFMAIVVQRDKLCIDCINEKNFEKAHIKNQNYREKNQETLPPKTKPCIVCKKDFETKGKRSVTCSEACRVQRNRDTRNSREG